MARYLLLLGVAVLIAGADAALAQSPASPAVPPPPVAASSTPAGYIVGPNDVLTVDVDEERERYNRAYTVQVDGTITLYNLRAVKVANLTVLQIEDLIEKLLKDGKFINNPTVTVNVIDHRSQLVSVQGEVASPGERALKGNQMTVSRAINAAGGYRATAATEIEVRRDVPRPDGKVDRTTTKLIRENLDKGEDFTLVANDVVHVPKAPQFFVNGEVRTSACVVVWLPDMNVYKAIASCGGLNEKGKVNKSHIQRPNAKGGYDRVKDLKNETPIKPGDILVVGKGLI